MKSQFLQTAFDDTEADSAKLFAKHLRETMALQNDELNACVAVLPRLRLLRTDAERQRLLDELVKDRPESRIRLGHALSVLSLFMDALLLSDLPESDPALWADDLVELGWLEQSAADSFQAVLSRLRSQSHAIQPQILRRGATSGVLPSFAGCDVTVEVRAVRGAKYKWGTPVEEYRPTIVDVTPVLSVHVGLDTGQPQDFFFQMGEDQVAYLISELLAAQKDISALKSFLKVQ